MTRSYRIAIAGLFVLALVLTAPAEQSPDQKVVDPVCGMSIMKSQAKATYEYEGETYHFCSTGCKDRFAKDPEAYLAKLEVRKAGSPAEKGEPMPQAGAGMRHGQTAQPPAGAAMMPGGRHAMMGGMMHGRAMMARRMPMGMMMRHGHGLMMAGPMMCGCGSDACPMMAEGVERQVEKTADGVVIKVTAKDPELVKKIQAHVDRMAAAAASAGSCPPDCPMKKAESPKEVKK